MDFKNSVSWQVTCCQQETLAAHQRENPTTSTLQATEDAQSLADRAQEGVHGPELAGTTQLGQGTGDRASQTSSTPEAAHRTPKGCFSSPLQWDFHKKYCVGTFVLGETPLPARSQRSLLASAGGLCQKGKGLLRTGNFPHPDCRFLAQSRAPAAHSSPTPALPECYRWPLVMDNSCCP